MSAMPWFRFYSETLSDRKLARVGRLSGFSRLTVMGAWATLLALANEGPQRGHLMLGEGQPLMDDEVRSQMELEEEAYERLMGGFRSTGVIRQGNQGEWVITNWDKRNFESDNAPPTGDLLRYCQGMAKGGNGREVELPDPDEVRERVHQILREQYGEEA